MGNLVARDETDNFEDGTTGFEIYTNYYWADWYVDIDMWRIGSEDARAHAEFLACDFFVKSVLVEGDPWGASFT